MIEVNIKGVLYGIAAVLPCMRTQVAVISSISRRLQVLRFSFRTVQFTAPPNSQCGRYPKACVPKRCKHSLHHHLSGRRGIRIEGGQHRPRRGKGGRRILCPMVVMRANIDLNRCDVERHGIRCLRRAISNQPYGSGTPSSAARGCYNNTLLY